MKRIIFALSLLFISGQCYAAVELDADEDGAVDVSRGGTGGVTAEAARTALGAAPALTADQNLVSDAQLTVIGNTSGTNTGDNATNSQYSGLAASKQDALTNPLVQADLDDTPSDGDTTHPPTANALVDGLALKLDVADGINLAVDGTTIEQTGTEPDITLNVVSAIATKEVGWLIKNTTTDTAVADGLEAFVVPISLNGMLLVDLTCAVANLNSAASGTTTVVLRRVRGATAADMTSTGVTINYDAYTESDETVDTANDDLATGDKIYVDVNAVTTAVQKGLGCTASFRLP